MVELRLKPSRFSVADYTGNSATEWDNAFDDRWHVVDKLLPPLRRVRVVQTRPDPLYVPTLRQQQRQQRQQQSTTE